jgi:hypothetical protein
MICYDASVRTTIILPDQLLTNAKRFAQETGRPLTRLIEDALRETLARHNHPKTLAPVDLPTFGGGALMPGVELDNGAALLELMERGDDSA